MTKIELQRCNMLPAFIYYNKSTLYSQCKAMTQKASAAVHSDYRLSFDEHCTGWKTDLEGNIYVKDSIRVQSHAA